MKSSHTAELNSSLFVLHFSLFFMQTIDIIIAVLLAIGLVSGLRDGLVKQVAGLAGLIGGLLLGRAFYLPLGTWMATFFNISSEAAHIAAFIVILVVVPLLFNLVGWLVSKFLSAICLGWVNRLLGGLVGVIKFTLLTGVLITGIEFFDKHDAFISEQKKMDSVLYYPIYDATSIFFDGIKEEFKKLNLQAV